MAAAGLRAVDTAADGEQHGRRSSAHILQVRHHHDATVTYLDLAVGASTTCSIQREAGLAANGGLHSLDICSAVVADLLLNPAAAGSNMVQNIAREAGAALTALLAMQPVHVRVVWLEQTALNHRGCNAAGASTVVLASRYSLCAALCGAVLATDGVDNLLCGLSDLGARMGQHWVTTCRAKQR